MYDQTQGNVCSNKEECPLSCDEENTMLTMVTWGKIRKCQWEFTHLRAEGRGLKCLNTIRQPLPHLPTNVVKDKIKHASRHLHPTVLQVKTNKHTMRQEPRYRLGKMDTNRNCCIPRKVRGRATQRLRRSELLTNETKLLTRGVVAPSGVMTHREWG